MKETFQIQHIVSSANCKLTLGSILIHNTQDIFFVTYGNSK